MILETYKEYEEEQRLFKGCYNRICVTDNREELTLLYSSARQRLEKIFQYRYRELSDKKSPAAAAEADCVQQELFSRDK